MSFILYFLISIVWSTKTHFGLGSQIVITIPYLDIQFLVVIPYIWIILPQISEKFIFSSMVHIIHILSTFLLNRLFSLRNYQDLQLVQWYYMFGARRIWAFSFQVVCHLRHNGVKKQNLEIAQGAEVGAKVQECLKVPS